MVYINNYGQICCDDYLAHHGILGQKYGVRNGPPCPLGSGAHSASERKAGWRDSLKGKNPDRYVSRRKARIRTNTKKAASSDMRYGAQAKSKDTPAKKNKDSDNSSAAKFAVAVALDAIRLNPIGLAMDSKRLIDYGRSKVKQALEDKRVSKLEIDKKTGFHLKNKDATPEEDMKHINPGYKNFNANSKNNCMLCTTAYELRRRGYDVQAGTTTIGFQNKKVTEWFPKGKLESVYTTNMSDRKEVIKAGFNIGGKEKYKKLSDSLLKHGDGARGNLMVGWNTHGGGHSVVWENQNGKVILRDCQSGKTYKSEGQIAKLLSKTVNATYVRTDNVDFDKNKLKGLIR